MKLQSFLVFAIATGAFAQASLEHDYKRICYALDGQEEDILPGYRVKYTCDFYGQHNGSPVEGVESAKACAKLCQTASASCTGSSWSMKERKCLLSGSNSEGKRMFTVYMEKVGEAGDPFGEDEGEDPFGADESQDDDPFGADEPEEDDPFGADEPEEDDPFGLDEPEDDDPFGVDEPEEDDPFGGDEPEEEDPFGADEPEDEDTACGCDNCEVDVACEFSPIPNYENAADCYLGGYPDEASPALKGKAYKIFCQKRKWHLITIDACDFNVDPVDDVGGKNIRPPFKVNSVKECIEACSIVPKSQCKRAIWTNSRDAKGQRSCWLREWNGVKKVPTKVGSWSSAHVQE
ncbi:hypothetical protein P875_00033774 [Aspergillus parasiticus SU-1]|uniref:Apple domain-containing protein n=1 Tax=Aspergillus parasiticus (strain ATCC 56775 / NRRL 5862 / SRRC 143 / SU-1) TaxID=1403190 RepID=A0A0F0I6M3_ASPPU|nr:hypothetical protein P875_00033774 [Aspergillus parasiticus SU-1]